VSAVHDGAMGPSSQLSATVMSNVAVEVHALPAVAVIFLHVIVGAVLSCTTTSNEHVPWW
jgi:hypothetical protein